MKIGLCIATVSLMSGCAGYQQQQQQAALASTQAVCHAAASDARLTVIRPRIPENAHAASIRQLADTSYPSQEEKEGIAILPDVMHSCYKATVEYFNKYVPGATPFVEEARQKQINLLSQLYAGKLTYGQYNTASGQVAAAALAAATQAEQLRIQQAQYLQLQQQQAAAAIINATRPVAPVYQAPYPTTTNCYRSGNSVSCTSY